MPHQPGVLCASCALAYGAFCLQCVSPVSLHWLLRVLFWCVCKPVEYFDGVCRASGRTADSICSIRHLTALLQLAVRSSKACYSNTRLLRATGLVSGSAGKETSFLYVLYLDNHYFIWQLSVSFPVGSFVKLT